MRIENLQLAEGGKIANLTLASGTDWPTEPTDGELFRKLGTGAGIYAYLTDTWEPVFTGTAPVSELYATLTQSGSLQVLTGEARWYPPRNCTITLIQAFIGTASVGGNVGFALRKNGTLLDTGSISAGVNRAEDRVVSYALTTSDYLTFDVTATGVSEPGKYLVVRFKME